MFIYTQASVGLDCKPGSIQEKLFNYLFNLAKYTGNMYSVKRLDYNQYNRLSAYR